MVRLVVGRERNARRTKCPPHRTNRGYPASGTRRLGRSRRASWHVRPRSVQQRPRSRRVEPVGIDAVHVPKGRVGRRCARPRRRSRSPPAAARVTSSPAPSGDQLTGGRGSFSLPEHDFFVLVPERLRRTPATVLAARSRSFTWLRGGDPSDTAQGDATPTSFWYRRPWTGASSRRRGSAGGVCASYACTSSASGVRVTLEPQFSYVLVSLPFASRMPAFFRMASFRRRFALKRLHENFSGPCAPGACHPPDGRGRPSSW